MPPTKTLSQLWSTSSTVLVLAVASAALAWRDCMLLALSMVLAYRLFPLQMDRGAPWRAIAAAVHVISAGLLAAGAGVALLVGVAAARLGWWQPTAGHPGELLVILIMGSAWCCLSGRGHQAVAEEIRFWVVLFVGAIGARELHVSGWTGALGAKLAAEQTASNLGLTRTTRFVNVLELGVMRNSSNEAPTQRGWEIGFELPLFDWGGARVARAEAVYMQTLHRAAEVAINARSELREAYTGYRSAYDIARHHRDEIVPLNQRIAEENVLRYNGMLIGVFELLADARTQIASVNASIEALRDFWLAQADLDMAFKVRKPAGGHSGH